MRAGREFVDFYGKIFNSKTGKKRAANRLEKAANRREKKELCSVTNIGDKLELTVEVMQQKGGVETTETYTLKLPHDLDGIIINLPA